MPPVGSDCGLISYCVSSLPSVRLGPAGCIAVSVGRYGCTSLDELCFYLFILEKLCGVGSAVIASTTLK